MDAIVERLPQVGFSLYEARLYAALLRHVLADPDLGGQILGRALDRNSDGRAAAPAA